MGAGQSGMEIAGSSMGYQVLRVYPDSPGSKAGLVAYFDFIIAIGNTRFNKETGSFREILKASLDQKLNMVVFNTRTKTTREVQIIPSTNWGGNGLLGVSIKHASYDKADERVWHVVEVEPGSPAQQAGFKANEDYVIGSDSILQENDDLYNLVEAHEGKALKLFVYNINNDNCREVICYPNSKWGGKGYLGCEFGHGLLHRIPSRDKDGGIINQSEKASLISNQHPVATSGIKPVAQPVTPLEPIVQKPQCPPPKQLLQQALSFNAFALQQPLEPAQPQVQSVQQIQPPPQKQQIQPPPQQPQMHQQMQTPPLPQIQEQPQQQQQQQPQLNQQPPQLHNPVLPQLQPLQQQQKQLEPPPQQPQLGQMIQTPQLPSFQAQLDGTQNLQQQQFHQQFQQNPYPHLQQQLQYQQLQQQIEPSQHPQLQQYLYQSQQPQLPPPPPSQVQQTPQMQQQQPPIQNSQLQDQIQPAQYQHLPPQLQPSQYTVSNYRG